MVNKCLTVVVLVLCFAWQAYATANCTQVGPGRHPDPVDNTCRNYTLCIFANATYTFYDYSCPTTSLFNPNSGQCTAPTNFTCTVTATCTADGFIADPNSTNCSSYIQCVNINGAFTQTTLTCPGGSLYNPATTNCETNYTCPTNNG